MKTKGQAPLWEALLEYRQKKYNSWHTPGHKNGGFAWPHWRQAMGDTALGMDLTEVPGLDNLSSPRGAIKAAQEEAAEFFGAARTFFLVNGSSSGLVAVLMAACRPGDEVLLPRYAHKAVYNGIILAGAKPVYLESQWLANPHLPLGVNPDVLVKALKKCSRAKMVLLVHPTYEGIVSRSREIINIAHANGVLVLADAAHGAHFGLSPYLPPSPLTQGADFVVQSTHKTLGALTQAAMLHLRDEKYGDIIAEGLNLIQTTSPSYLLLASLDTARLMAASRGKCDWDRTGVNSLRVRERIKAAGIPCLEMQDIQGTAAAGLDITRLVIPLVNTDMNGEEAAVLLRRAGQEIELAAPDYIIIIITPGDSEGKLQSLQDALTVLCRPGFRQQKATKIGTVISDKLPKQVLTPREAWLLPRRELPVQEAEGYIAGELVAPSPPGMAITVPGEIINGDTVRVLAGIRGNNGKIKVVDDR